MVDGVLRAFLTLLEGALGLWPEAATVAGSDDAPPLAVQYLAGLQGVADVASVLAFVMGLLLVFPALLAVKGLLFLWSLLPGKAT